MTDKTLEGKTISGNKGKYKIIERIGAGGFGEVWRAEDGQNTVAVKILRPEHYQNGGVDKFIQEGDITQKLKHKHIIHTFEAGQDDNLGPYIVMDYLDGGNLNSYLQHGGLDTSRARQIIIDVAGALAYAHSEGVLHRDIHPGNILFDKEGRAVLTDFGLAAVMKSSRVYGSIINSVSQSHATAPTNINDALKQIFHAMERSGGKDTQLAETVKSLWIGVREYAAHEIFSSGTGIKAATDKSDQFSLSRVAHKLLIGVLKDGRYTDILQKAAAVEPQERFASMKDFITAIQTVPDYLSSLRQKKKEAAGKRLSREGLEEICTLGEKGYKEEPINKERMKELLAKIHSEQYSAYYNFFDALNDSCHKNGELVLGVDTDKAGKIFLDIQQNILPLFKRMKALQEQK